VSEEVGENRSLLVCCSAFRVKDLSPFPNLTVKKIPKMVLNRCEWGHDDYSLEIENLPSPPPELARELVAERSNGRKSRAAESLSLFDVALETEGEGR
jgi:adenine-specific DNA-methyltransferase